MVLKFEIDKEVERKFRELALSENGFTKGSLQKAANQAFSDWVKKRELMGEVTFNEAMDRLTGCLSHLKGKYTSVELQHEAMKLWAKQD